MKLSLMLVLVCAVLCIGGIGKRTLMRAGIDTAHTLFFLLCVLTTAARTICPSDDAEISAACILIAVWTFGFAFSEKAGTRKKLLIIPISLAVGAVSGIIRDETAAASVTALFAVLMTAAFGMSFGVAFGGLAPLIYYVSVFVFSVLSDGFGYMEIGETVLRLSWHVYCPPACLQRPLQMFVRTYDSTVRAYDDI